MALEEALQIEMGFICYVIIFGLSMAVASEWCGAQPVSLVNGDCVVEEEKDFLYLKV